MREFGEKAVPLHTRDDLAATLRRACRLSIPVLLQELVPGPSSAIVHVSVYADATSSVRGLFVARKTRQYPSQFGNACFIETAPCPEAVSLAASLVKAISYHGIAGAIEFKRHPRTGRLHFIEINPRAAGSVSAAAAAGVNLPHLAYLDALGETLPEMTLGEQLVRWIEGRGDFRHWLAYRKGDHTGQPLPLGAYLHSLRGPRHYAYWAVDDLRPWAARVIGASGDALRALAASRASRPGVS
jgi:predicted ATP-grasp superfamily ATP-dependent carboligase